LHRWLRRLDPETAGRVPSSDHVRIVRSLEVALLTGRAHSQQLREWSEEGERHSSLKIGLQLPREILDRRIEERAELMFQSGLLEEVQGLLDAGLPESANAFHALGYKEAVRVLRGEWDVETGVAELQRATRRLARRQMTWFRSEPGVRWIEAAGPTDEVGGRIVEAYRSTAP
jgi:tRNA dimethylallyltransferase